MKQNKNWINSSSIEVFLHGLVMGTINKLPGISGGLYAIVIGFYSHLMLSIKNINKESLKDLLTFRISLFSEKINGRFLLFLSMGMIVSYFTTSRLLDFMLFNYELYVWSLFFGLILGSLYVIVKRTKNTNSVKIIIFLIGISFGLILSFSEPMIENRNLIFIFFCGFISICGITLPGLSGSFLLILLGNYELLLVDSVNNLYNFIIGLISNQSTFIIDNELINILLIFFLGSVLGLIILSNFLSFISKKYPLHLNHLIIGFVSGTLPVVWPWNKIDIEISKTELLNFETIFAFLIILLSIILIIYINHSVDKKKTFGLIGKNIDYSFSRSYFSKKFKKLRLSNCEYINYDLKSIEELSTINLNGVYGLNVTIPYKTEIIKFLYKIDPEAEKIGAVNTIKINRKGLIGFNTDYIGFLKSLPRRKFKRALIFGTGGASKAVQHALNKINIPFEIVSRKNDKKYLSYSNLDSKITVFDLIINTTPVGTYPNTNSILEIPYDLIDSSHTCFDLIYNPIKTRFLTESEKNGAHIINGLPMLEFQAEASWDIWNS